MLTANVAFCFCLVIGVFEETVSWTIDLPQVRKYFFEKRLDDRDRYDTGMKDRDAYDNINTHSLHTDYDKYRDHYADDYKYHGYMEQKNIVQFRPNFSTANLTNPSTSDVTNPSISTANLTNFNLPTNFTINVPPNNTYISQLSTNFTQFMELSTNYTMFNVSEGLKDCMRAELASEHVRRLAQLAVWAASELQDKLYADRYKDSHGHENGREHDEALVLRLAWFLDRLAHLTGYDPRPGDLLRKDKDPSSPLTPPSLTLMPTLVSTRDLRRLLSCVSETGEGGAPSRCSLLSGGAPDPGYMSKGWPAPSTFAPDLKLSASENQEYTYSEQDFTDDDMPLSLPQRSTKTKRSIPTDPLQNLLQYYTKYKAWDGSNQNQVKDSSEITSNAIKTPKRTKRFIIKKKFKHFKPEKPLTDLSIIKQKIGVHIKKDEKEAKTVKKFLEKLVKKPKTEVRVLKFKKQKRSIKYSKKVQPRVPLNPQGDISYYVKNKPGRNYNYNAGQAALVRAGVEQVFQTGNILVVQRYGSNYNPANTMQIAAGYMAGYSDV